MRTRILAPWRRRVALTLVALALTAATSSAAALGWTSGGAPSPRADVNLDASDLRRQKPPAGSPLDSRLAPLATADGAPGRSVLGFRAAGIGLTRVGGRVRVVIEATEPAAVREAVRRLGGQVERSWRGLVQALVVPDALSVLSQLPSVDRVRAPYQRVANSVDGEEVAASGAPGWHTRGLTGQGVKVAIIDGGFAGYAELQASGDLPQNVVTADFCGGDLLREEHGTAVAEIVHEMAPEAELYFLCIDTEVDLAAAEAFAESHGVQVVSHSLSWFGPERGDGSGLIGDIVGRARAAGILWVNSAGNYGETHWSGPFTSTDGDTIHEWGPATESNFVRFPNNTVICGFLRWDEWPAAISDLDLFLFVPAANVVLPVSLGYQTGTQPAIEGGCAVNQSGADVDAAWVINGYRVTTAPRIDFFEPVGPSLQHQVAGGSIADPASSPAALAVGAVCWQTNELELYSSQGPTIDGRPKPDIAGHDSFSSSIYGASGACGIDGFSGTSASAPQVAGAAALVQGAYPDFGPDDVQAFLEEHAIDLGAAGEDDQFGAGQLSLADREAPVVKALAAVGKTGRIVKLLSKVSDDFGEARLREQVFRGGKVIATLQTGFMPVQATRTISVAWKAPAAGSGQLKHCVQARDRAGNVSRTTCAKVTLR